MTSVVDAIGDTSISQTRRRLAIVFLSTYVVLLIAAGGGQIVDPFFHYDDYPAFALDPEGYYLKTLQEGRWVNYLWHLRGVFTPSWMNFQICLIGWALFFGGAALSIFRSADIRYPALLAALLALSPQNTLIAGWFNTLIPGVWLLATYAIATLFLSPRMGKSLLLIFVPLTMQAYTPYPFLLLAIAMMREDQPKTLRAFLDLITVFALAFALGMLIIYVLNYTFHDVFGVTPADWRRPEPARNLADLIANLPNAATSLHEVYISSGFGKPALSALILAALLACIFAIYRMAALELLFILTPSALGLGLLSLHASLEGIMFPFRSTYFVWVTLAICIMRFVNLYAHYGSRNSSTPLALTLLFSLTIGGIVRTHNQNLSAWQHETRVIAAQIPAETQEVFVYGTHLAVNGPRGPFTQMPKDMQYRLTYLTGVRTEMCTVSPESCERVTPPFEPSATGEGLVILQSGTTTFIRLPVTEFEG